MISSVMSFSVLEVLEIIVIYQCISFAVHLFLTQGIKSSYNFFLAVLLMVIALNFLNVLLLSLGTVSPKYNFGLVFGFLYGPLLYSYTVKTIYKNAPSSKGLHPIHVAPALIVFFLSLWNNFSQIIAQALIPITILVVIHILTYIFLSARKIILLGETLKTNFSTIENKNLNWLKSILIVFAVITLFTLLEAVLPEKLRNQSNIPLAGIILFTLFTVNLIYFRGLSYPELFNDYVIRTKGEKYAGSKLTQEYLEDQLNRIESFMQKQKPYLDFELTLKDLADKIGIHPRELSQTINEKRDLNFYEFVNYYRTEEAKKLLLQHDRESMRIKEVMYSSGFSSKSTFNSIFKKSTGKTPRQFRQDHLH